MDNFNLTTPVLKDNKWLIFPDTIFDRLEVMDCNDSIDGTCHTDKNFDQCIKTCENNPHCGAGYFISGKQIDDDICVPLRTSIYRDINPIYRLRNQNMYPELKNLDVKTFVDETIFRFPPAEANNVFFMDHLLIKNIEDNSLLETSPLSYPFNYAKFTSNGSLQVQLLPIKSNVTMGTHYRYVNYGEPFVINIPGTTLILRESKDANRMIWVPKRDAITSSDAFYIYPIMSDKKLGDPVLYSDNFSIKYEKIDTLSVSKTTHFVTIYYNTYEEAKDRDYNVTFTFIPKMKGYYCNENSECTEMKLEDLEIDDESVGRYEGLHVGRNPGCWGVCKYKVKGYNKIKPFDSYQPPINSYFYLIPIILFVTLIILIVYTPQR